MKAHAPYSRFQVGAAVLTDDGRVFSGCNIENASYGLTVCAERIAIFSAVASGYRKIQAVAIQAHPETLGHVPEEFKSVPPCGACRQVMAEFMDDDGLVILGGGQQYRLGELLPQAFRKP